MAYHGYSQNLFKLYSYFCVGTICVTLSFPFIFNPCLICQPDWSVWLHVIWFIPFIMLFHFGWASAMIAHLAMIPELSHIDSCRTTMNSLRYPRTSFVARFKTLPTFPRYGFTVLASLTLFGILLCFFSFGSDEQTFGPSDVSRFRVGSIFFYVWRCTVSICKLSVCGFYCRWHGSIRNISVLCIDKGAWTSVTSAE